MRRGPGRLGRVAVAVAVAVAVTAGTATTAAAAETGRIIEVTAADGRVRVVFQADGLESGVRLDTESVTMSVAGEAVEPIVQPLSTRTDALDRTVVVAIDNSRSMAGGRLAAAKAAGGAFLDDLPDDIAVGLVTFADVAAVAVEPTTDRDAVQTAIDGLAINDVTGTALFDGTALAAEQAGDTGLRSVLLLTDGNEDGSSALSLDAAVAAVQDGEATLDAVYIGADRSPPAELAQLVTGAGGRVVDSATADLTSVFRQAAQAITSQILVEGDIPSSAGRSGTVVVSAEAGDVVVTDSAFARFGSAAPAQERQFGPRPVQQTAPIVATAALPVLLGALFCGLLIVLYVAFTGADRDETHGRVRRRLSFYTLAGRQPVKKEELSTALGSSAMARAAVGLAGRMVQRRDFESSLGLRLEAAGVPLRAAEWMLVHIGVAVMAALLFLILSGGRIAPTVVGLLLGLAVPFAYLRIKAARRTARFLAQLPDTLQLIAGSISVGYSIPQAMDTVVRQGTQPITGEFNRALVEARLGVQIEDAMDGIADRMTSKDFAWVVLVVRIQREVGGNLAELLTIVATTLRERERLRRQVQGLSAEGRLSAWILGLLPVAFAVYLLIVRPDYLRPLVESALGWLLLVGGAILLLVGVVWMSRAVKVDV